MTKKMLQGIATGILITTLIFAYNFYFTNNFTVIKEVPIESTVSLSEEEIEEYLETHNLIAVKKEDYDELRTNLMKSEENGLETEEEIVEIDEKDAVDVLFIIDPGTSSGTVGRELKEKGLINDRQQFENFLINSGLETKIKAGEYQLSTDMSLEEIVKKIT